MIEAILGTQTTNLSQNNISQQEGTKNPDEMQKSTQQAVQSNIPKMQTINTAIISENQPNVTREQDQVDMRLSRSRSNLQQCRPTVLQTVRQSAPHLEEASPQIKQRGLYRNFTNFAKGGEEEKKGGLRRASQSVSGHPWSFQVKHVVIKEETLDRDENQPDNRSYSQVSSDGDQAKINRQIEQQFLEEYDKKNADFFKTMEAQDSNQSGEDNREAKIRAEEILRLAAESKMRIQQELQNSQKLRQEMQSERSFGKKVLSSFVASAVVGTATILFTKNKRNSVLASLATLACSFIIQ